MFAAHHLLLTELAGFCLHLSKTGLHRLQLLWQEAQRMRRTGQRTSPFLGVVFSFCLSFCFFSQGILSPFQPLLPLCQRDRQEERKPRA
jgi:hypothetical protein